MPFEVPPQPQLVPLSTLPGPSLPDPAALRRIDSAALLGRRGEVLIVHHEQVYRLRVTSQGKLLLTK